MDDQVKRTGRIRVMDLASELAITKMEVVKLAQSIGANAYSAVSYLKADQAESVRRIVQQRQAPAKQPKLAPARVQVDSVAKPKHGGRTARCTCCGLPFTYNPSDYVGSNPPPEHCRECGGHFEILGEDAARRTSRLADHDQRLRHAFDVAADRANEYERRMKDAYASRQKWIAALAEVILAHYEKADRGCKCGSERYPCYTVSKLEEANRGIAREIEKLGTLPDEELERRLYPDEAPRVWGEDF